MDRLFHAFFDTRLLNPHGICLLWRPELLWTHVFSDLAIGAAYFSIPLALGVFLYHRRDVRFGWAVWMFVAFIMLCGVTHLMSIWTLWNPDYGIEALVKAATALASVLTAVALWPLLPRVIAIPSTEILQARVAERDEALAQLRAATATTIALEEHRAEQGRLVAELRTKEAQLRSVFENAAVGIARVGLDGTFLEINTRYAEIAGWSVEEMIGGGFQRITHPDDLDSDLEHMGDLLAGGRNWYAMEKRYVRADGGIVWVKLTGSIVRKADGEPDHFVAIAEDITEDKRTREAHELLMREVDHRARNALTVVQSMVRLTETPDPQAFREVVIGRVDALARAQASLSKSNWEGALIADVVAEELRCVAEMNSVELHGPVAMLKPDDVQPLSMLVHELATNAAKYGSLSRPGGRVRVEWEVRDGAPAELLWIEMGGPAVERPRRRGFGTRLIERLASQLRKRPEFHWSPQGLRFRLTA